MKYYLYILKSSVKDKFYTGSSDNPPRRLGFHNTIEKGFTARYRPWKIAFTEEFESKSEALKAERKVKSWKSKKMIRKLINREINIKDYL
ncbi:GIY-YIG nuclease superfamily protein [bacterium BMS3Abin03]|nr:GIY-YIG nuclease superfamily protein [bacterium BMS3Abin03]